MNSIMVIAPYQHFGMWVFDDERAGLVQEPFVGGADTIIDYFTRDIPGAKNGFRLTFAAVPFPGFEAKLVWRREEMSGNVYEVEGLGMEGWLCPALFKYFDKAPSELYAKFDPLP